MNKLDLFKTGVLNKEELLLLFIIEEKKVLKLEEVLELKICNIKETINKLDEGDYIYVDFINNTIASKQQVDVMDTFSKNNKTSIQKDVLSINDIDEIRVLINREIKNYELEMLKEWIKEYSLEQIKGSIYKSLIKNIDNFKYIEKVLYNDVSNNSDEKKLQQETFKKTTRKFDFFD